MRKLGFGSADDSASGRQAWTKEFLALDPLPDPTAPPNASAMRHHLRQVLHWYFRPGMMDGLLVKDSSGVGRSATGLANDGVLSSAGSSLVPGWPSLNPGYPCGVVHSGVWRFSAPEDYLTALRSRSSYGGRLQFRCHPASWQLIRTSNFVRQTLIYCTGQNTTNRSRDKSPWQYARNPKPSESESLPLDSRDGMHPSPMRGTLLYLPCPQSMPALEPIFATSGPTSDRMEQRNGTVQTTTSGPRTPPPHPPAPTPSITRRPGSHTPQRPAKSAHQEARSPSEQGEAYKLRGDAYSA